MSHSLNEALDQSHVVYQLKIETGNKTHADTDGKVFAVIHGSKGSSDKLNLDNPGDDFEKGATNQFIIRGDNHDCGDLGQPYAVSLFLDSSDGWQVTNIEISYWVAKTKKSTLHWHGIAKFGDKGDFGLAEAVKGRTFFDGRALDERTTVRDAQVLVGTRSYIIDNIGDDYDSGYFDEEITEEFTLQSILTETQSQETTASVSFASETGGFLTPKSRWEIETSFTKFTETKKEILNKKSVSKTHKVKFNAPAHKIQLKIYSYYAKVSYEKMKSNGVDLNIFGQDVFSNTTMVLETNRSFDSLDAYNNYVTSSPYLSPQLVRPNQAKKAA